MSSKILVLSSEKPKAAIEKTKKKTKAKSVPMGIGSIRCDGRRDSSLSVAANTTSAVVSRGPPLDAESVRKYNEERSKFDAEYGDNFVDIRGARLYGVVRMPAVMRTSNGSVFTFTKANDAFVNVVSVMPGHRIIMLFSNQ